MTKRMLIDSTHAEETRVVVLDGNRLEEYDVETSTKRQLKGNIYLAKIVRVEPSLQAAFVEYGGNRHGFLAFGEIHPDYYQIPVADRKRLLEAQEAEAREDEEAAEREAEQARTGHAGPNAAPDHIFGTDPAVDGLDAESPEPIQADPDPGGTEPVGLQEQAPELQGEAPAAWEPIEEAPIEDATVPPASRVAQPAAVTQDILVAPEEAATLFPAEPDEEPGSETGADMVPEAAGTGEQPDIEPTAFDPLHEGDLDAVPAEPPEQIGGETEEPTERRSTPRFLRNYKIQEVIRRRQIMLVQVVKEERGNKARPRPPDILFWGAR